MVNLPFADNMAHKTGLARWAHRAGHAGDSPDGAAASMLRWKILPSSAQRMVGDWTGTTTAEGAPAISRGQVAPQEVGYRRRSCSGRSGRSRTRARRNDGQPYLWFLQEMGKEEYKEVALVDSISGIMVLVNGISWILFRERVFLSTYD
uniref:Uncharacterized protein n=1 Tax=Oryza sativa subsp. japonica TaxID=39947 RepID=Q2R4K4_ORYSJ|nr:hypothetical protein LOC_Os11g28170 [Oryza sativa Japonica Group]